MHNLCMKAFAIALERCGDPGSADIGSNCRIIRINNTDR